MSLPRALQTDPQRVADALGGLRDERSFTALNSAFAGAGAWIELDDGADAEDPLQLLFLTVGQQAAFMSHPRIVVRLGAGARLRLIESHVGFGAGASLTNLVSQIELAAGSVLEHDRVELVTPECTQIGKAYVRLDHRSKLVQTVATLGGGAGAQRDRGADRGQGRRVPAQRPLPRPRPGACRQPDPHPPHGARKPLRPVLQGHGRRPRARGVRRQDHRPQGRAEDQRVPEERQSPALRRCRDRHQARARDLRRRREVQPRRHLRRSRSRRPCSICARAACRAPRPRAC